MCLTTCYAAKQGLIAAALAAEYIAPYLGRMCDLGKDGMEECSQLHAAVGGSNQSTRVLVASIRSVQQMMQLRSQGLNTFTFSPAICDELLHQPDTCHAAEEFERAASGVASQ